MPNFHRQSHRQSGYSIWMLIATIAILAVLGTITLDKFIALDKLPQQISYVPKITVAAFTHPSQFQT